MTERNDIHDLLSIRDVLLGKLNKELGATVWTDVLNAEVPEWLVPGLLQEQAIQIVSSDSGTGKSWLALSLMLSGLYGVPVLGQQPTKPFSSIYIAADSPRWDIKQQLTKLIRGNKLGPPPHEPHAFVLPLGFQFENTDHVKLLADFARHWDIDAIFFDVMLYMHTADENNNGEMSRRVLHPAKWLRDNCGLSLFFLHHNSKPQMGQPIGVYRGAGTIVQAAEHHHSLRKKKDAIILRIEKLRGDELIPGGEIEFTIASANGGRILKVCEPPEEEEAAVPASDPPLINILSQSGPQSTAALLFTAQLHHLIPPGKDQDKWLDNKLQYLRRTGRIQSTNGLWSLCPPPN